MDNPPQTFSPSFAASGERREPPLTGDERELLVAYLEYHRQTFVAKCAGLSAGQLSTMALPPSRLSLHGILRHLAGVERWWFRIHLTGEDVPLLYYSDDDPDQDFESLDGDPAEALASWQSECERSRANIAAAALDDEFPLVRNGEPKSVRALLLSMIAEYARHNGHADLLRERLDGATGY
jgi:hypothetical protein